MTPRIIRAVRNTALALSAVAALAACAGRHGVSADPSPNLNGPDMFIGLDDSLRAHAADVAAAAEAGTGDLRAWRQDNGWSRA